MLAATAKQSRAGYGKKAIAVISCAVILLSSFGAAADAHLANDIHCVLCQLSAFTPAVETCSLAIPTPDIVGVFTLPDTVSPFLEVFASADAARSPPYPFL